MAKKRGLAANRGLDALLGSIKKEKAITQVALQDASVMAKESQTSPNAVTESVAYGSLSNDDPSLITEEHLQSTTAKDASINTSSNKRNTKKVAASVKKATTSKAKDAVGQARHSTKANSLGSNDARDVNEEQGEQDICLVQIEVEALQAGKYQPRRDMSESALAELATSIEKHGVMQPIVIRPLLDNEDKVSLQVTHEIIAGERRWRAAKMAGKQTIPAIERALSDELAIALALIENIQREDLSVIEQAAALQRFNTEFGMSHAMIADVVGKARTTVSNLLRLNQLHETVKSQLNDALLDMGHARALLSLPADQQPIIAQKIIDGSMTVREAEQLVKSILHPKKVGKAKQQNADIIKLAETLSDKLGAKVKFKQKKDGKGSMEIFFHSHDELESLLQHFEK